MRATHFARPLEYRLEIPQDRIAQGGLLQGTLAVVNRDTSALTGLRLELALGHGVFKEVKEQGGRAVAVLERHTLAEDFALQPGEQRTAAWSLPLRMDCPATTTESGTFLLYGSKLDDPASRGLIDVPVALAAPLEAVITTLENHFAFDCRGRRYSDGFMEVRFKPPGTYPTLEEFLVAMRIGEDGLDLNFRCKLKGFQRGSKPGLRNRSTELSRTLPSREYLTPNGQPNREAYRRVFQEVLQEVTPSIVPQP